MHSDRLLINEEAVIFADEIDKNNNYETIVYDKKNKNLLTINSTGYTILKTISNYPYISKSQVTKQVKKTLPNGALLKDAEIVNFIEKLIEAQIILST